jgi:hypothetical protein
MPSGRSAVPEKYRKGPTPFGPSGAWGADAERALGGPREISQRTDAIRPLVLDTINPVFSWPLILYCFGFIDGFQDGAQG